jgi:hypothetical protein
MHSDTVSVAALADVADTSAGSRELPDDVEITDIEIPATRTMSDHVVCS